MTTLLNLWGNHPLFTSYLLAINIITIFIYGSDKLWARAGSRRVGERTLWLFALAGGSPGAILAMKLFRHKTRKDSFKIVLAAIFILQLAAGFWLARYFNLLGTTASLM